jgi:hypothetical protein
MKRTSALVAIAVLLAGSGAFATVIPIANSSFDAYYAGTTNVIQPAGAWDCAYLYGSGSGQDLYTDSLVGLADFPAWNGEATFGAQNLGSTYFNDMPDGSEGWVGPPGYAADSYLWQNLGVSFEPNKTYTLSVWVYDRKDMGLANVFARVDAGLTFMPGATVNFTAPANGSKALYTWTYTTGATVPEGQMRALVGELASPDGTQASFDNISLTVTPEPMTLGLIAVGVAAWLRRRSA